MSLNRVDRLLGYVSDWTLFIWILVTLTLFSLSEEAAQVLGNNILNYWLKYSLIVKTILEVSRFFITRIGRS